MPCIRGKSNRRKDPSVCALGVQQEGGAGESQCGRQHAKQQSIAVVECTRERAQQSCWTPVLHAAQTRIEHQNQQGVVAATSHGWLWRMHGPSQQLVSALVARQTVLAFRGIAVQLETCETDNCSIWGGTISCNKSNPKVRPKIPSRAATLTGPSMATQATMPKYVRECSNDAASTS
jgi:hypothetical protein